AFGAAARLYDDGERWQETLRVADRDDDGRRLAREDVVGEACGDDEVAQGGARRSPRHEERRGQDGEDYEEEVVARVPRGEGDERAQYRVPPTLQATPQGHRERHRRNEARAARFRRPHFFCCSLSLDLVASYSVYALSRILCAVSFSNP